MSVLQFISELIGHLAWPLVILVLPLVFRPQLNALVSELRFKELTLPGGAKMSFEERLEAGRVIASEMSSPIQDDAGVGSEANTRSEVIQRLAAEAPDGAIVLAFIEVDREIQRLAEQLEKPRWSNQTELLRVLRDRNLIDPASEQLFKVMRSARNAAAHGHRNVVTTFEAEEFIRQCELLKAALRAASQKL
ncbi:hypothetical protein LPW26_19305 [Rhodopseudomonas sp. HC1]|uniref:hypothetical protein n=1 Tax=Rhodopseudomonas infernalis TaxID=2897386 RepID=UPI001EE98422|nr:hypothetical protein [Rhodopseudomonas infernalis]MCG6206802.1 hypothetical protein [Rhodopseudomonas infernalis]